LQFRRHVHRLLLDMVTVGDHWVSPLVSSDSTVSLQERESFLLNHERCWHSNDLGVRQWLVVSEVFALRLGL
jgi:hypothetical protein